MGDSKDKGAIEVYSSAEGGKVETSRLELTEDEWRQRLTAEQYEIARNKGTERAFTGEYCDSSIQFKIELLYQFDARESD